MVNFHTADYGTLQFDLIELKELYGHLFIKNNI